MIGAKALVVPNALHVRRGASLKGVRSILLMHSSLNENRLISLLDVHTMLYKKISTKLNTPCRTLPQVTISQPPGIGDASETTCMGSVLVEELQNRVVLKFMNSKGLLDSTRSGTNIKTRQS